MTEKQVREIAGPRAHIEKGNARGEWVVNSVACWTPEDVRLAANEAE